MAARILIIGGSFGGLTTANTLRRRLSTEQAEITVIAQDPDFTFIPSLPWVAVGSRNLQQISFGLAQSLARHGIAFLHEKASRIDTERKTLVTDQAERPYDFLVIATGHRSANEAVPGLGPFDGPGHSLMSPQEASELHDAVARLLTEPGPVVLGAAPGASCIGPAYEFAFELDYLLRRRRLRHAVPMTFVTPEPWLGHLGMGGVGKIRQLLEGAFEERAISYHTSTAISKITENAVYLNESHQIPSVLAMIIPPLNGVAAVAGSDGLANPKGFVSVDESYRHPGADGVYAVGVAVAMPPVEDTPVPVNFPKTGHMTEQMAHIAAADIASRIGGKPTIAPWQLKARCVLDMGDRGIYMSVDPVRPPRDKIPVLSDGRRWLMAKRAFERVYLWNAKRGRGVPTALGW